MSKFTISSTSPATTRTPTALRTAVEVTPTTSSSSSSSSLSSSSSSSSAALTQPAQTIGSDSKERPHTAPRCRESRSSKTSNKTRIEVTQQDDDDDDSESDEYEGVELSAAAAGHVQPRDVVVTERVLEKATATATATTTTIRVEPDNAQVVVVVEMMEPPNECPTSDVCTTLAHSETFFHAADWLSSSGSSASAADDDCARWNQLYHRQEDGHHDDGNHATTQTALQKPAQQQQQQQQQQQKRHAVVARKEKASDPPTLSSFLQNCDTTTEESHSDQESHNNHQDGANDEDDDDDDGDSAATTTAYYDPSDFNPANWLIAMDAPTFGFAVVALATAVTHPLLFVAGALTAWGTATAAGMGYEYYFGRPLPDASTWAQLFCYKNTTTTTTTDQDTENNSSQKDHHIADTAVVGAIPALNHDDGGGSRGEDIPKAARHRVETGETSALVSESSRNEDPRTENQQHASSPTKSHAQHHGEKGQQQLHSSPLRQHHHHTLNDSHVLHSDGGLGAADTVAWMDSHYPRLDTLVVERDTFVGLNVIEFFQVFFADNAPYNFLEFQKKRGDIKIQYGPWQDIHSTNDTELAPSPLSMHPKATPDQNLDVDAYAHQIRTLRFSAKTNAFFGPPYATTIKTQSILIVNKRLAVLESKTVLEDIPFSDRFYVMERWLIQAEKDESDERYTSYLSASCEVIFTGKCPFEVQIRTKSKSTVMEVTMAWSVMAQQALKLAEKVKQQRLKEERGEEGTEKEHRLSCRHHSSAKSPEDIVLENQSIEIEHIAGEEVQPSRSNNAVSASWFPRIRSDTSVSTTTTATTTTASTNRQRILPGGRLSFGRRRSSIPCDNNNGGKTMPEQKEEDDIIIRMVKIGQVTT